MISVLPSHSRVILDECWTKAFDSIKQPFQGYLKLTEMYPILKALLKFCTTKNLVKSSQKSLRNADYARILWIVSNCLL